MRVIDFHTHVYPTKIAGKATASTCGFYNLKTDLVGTTNVLLECGRQAGISEFVLLPVATKAEQVHHINEFIVDEVNMHNEFYGFGALHADMENPLSEIEYIKSSGLKGIKLHPDIQHFPIDDERMFPVYDKLQGDLPVLIHCGDARFDYSHPRRLKHIIDEFPQLQIIAAHLGGWSMFDTAFEYLKDTDCYFDISSSMMFLTPEQMKTYISGYGADRILFGSDFPLWNPKNEVESFLSLELSEADREKIAFRNALKILKINP
ncbi:MAG: amidohydrolase family protein [Clostridia bacterium]|nr:amidohydrolase family protein [Clostridia bacterium]